MKYTILFIAFAIFSVSQANAQFRKSEFRIQTPDTSSASQTHYIYVGGTTAANALAFEDPGEFNLIMKFDSLSGNPNGTASVELCNDSDGTIWHTTGTTLTLNGVTATANYDDNDFSNAKVRVKIVNQSTTQSDKVQVAWAFKRRQ